MLIIFMLVGVLMWIFAIFMLLHRTTWVRDTRIAWINAAADRGRTFPQIASYLEGLAQAS